MSYTVNRSSRVLVAKNVTLVTPPQLNYNDGFRLHNYSKTTYRPQAGVTGFAFPPLLPRANLEMSWITNVTTTPPITIIRVPYKTSITSAKFPQYAVRLFANAC